MKKVLQKPEDELHGRRLFSTQFVSGDDVVGKNILDIGCGFGWQELNFLTRNAGHITGIEITDQDLEIARSCVPKDRTKFVVGSAIDIPLESSVYDTATAWEVIEHIPKKTEHIMLKEVYRVLKPGGVLYLSTQYNTFFGNALDPAWWLTGHRHYSRKFLNSLAQEIGFDVEMVVLKGGWWEIFGVLNLYISKWVFRRRPLYEYFFDKKQDEEYSKNNGFAIIFMRLRKPFNTPKI